MVRHSNRDGTPLALCHPPSGSNTDKHQKRFHPGLTEHGFAPYPGISSRRFPQTLAITSPGDPKLSLNLIHSSRKKKKNDPRCSSSRNAMKVGSTLPGHVQRTGSAGKEAMCIPEKLYPPVIRQSSGKRCVQNGLRDHSVIIRDGSLRPRKGGEKTHRRSRSSLRLVEHRSISICSSAPMRWGYPRGIFFSHQLEGTEEGEKR